jgi:hypothetical protein
LLIRRGGRGGDCGGSLGDLLGVNLPPSQKPGSVTVTTRPCAPRPRRPGAFHADANAVRFPGREDRR